MTPDPTSRGGQGEAAIEIADCHRAGRGITVSVEDLRAGRVDFPMWSMRTASGFRPSTPAMSSPTVWPTPASLSKSSSSGNDPVARSA
jgi:hypothetical protein